MGKEGPSLERCKVPVCRVIAPVNLLRQQRCLALPKGWTWKLAHNEGLGAVFWAYCPEHLEYSTVMILKQQFHAPLNPNPAEDPEGKKRVTKGIPVDCHNRECKEKAMLEVTMEERGQLLPEGWIWKRVWTDSPPFHVWTENPHLPGVSDVFLPLCPAHIKDEHPIAASEESMKVPKMPLGPVPDSTGQTHYFGDGHDHGPEVVPASESSASEKVGERSSLETGPAETVPEPAFQGSQEKERGSRPTSAQAEDPSP